MAASLSERIVVLPGDILTERIKSENVSKYKLGPGLRQELEEVVACKCGELRCRDSNVFWVDNNQKRYVPAKGETVIGIVTQKAGDVFRVDIGTNLPASLSYLAFEGATRRNKPNVQIGDLVFAKLLVANRDMEPELVCIDSSGQSNGLGVLEGNGFMFATSLNLVRKILSPDCQLLKLLGEQLPFELTAGMNGRIWIRTKSVPSTIALMNAISAAEFMSERQIQQMVPRVMNCITDF